MVTPSSVTGAPFLQPGGILKVGAQHQLARKQAAARAGHEKISPISTAMATRTSAPTLSCDH
jgi:hypothetical protein